MSGIQKIAIISIFPGLFENFLATSLVSKAIEKNLLQVKLFNLRDYSSPPHHRVDDTPYGGGPGMVMEAEPICLAIEAAKKELPKAQVVLMSASGRLFNQKKAAVLSSYSEIIYICGRYEGIDQRAIDLYVNQETSIGDYVLMGGEIAAMAVIEASVRLIPGVLGNKLSTVTESFSNNLLEAPQYTKPAEFRGLQVPAVLLSGNHEEIDKWRQNQAQLRTKTMRPDLLEKK